MVFSDMWWLPSCLESELLQKDDALDVASQTGSAATDSELLKKLIETYSHVSFDSNPANDVLKTAQVLAESYVKAYAEYQAALKQTEISVVHHHASLIADLVEQMLALLHYTKPKSDRDFTEFSLPDTHPQARS